MSVWEVTMSDFDLKIESAVASFLRNYHFEEKTIEKEFARTFDEQVEQKIEHTLLKSIATTSEIEKLCYEARQYGFRSVCVNPSFVSLADDLLTGTGVLVVTVVGFPLGTTMTNCKEYETYQAMQNGANEVDMVIHQGRLRSKDYECVLHDIRKVVKAAGSNPVKVILETCNLTKEEIIAGCLLAIEAGAQYVKTSTGFGAMGAKAEDIDLMRHVVGKQIGVKASGGIKDRASALRMAAYGADLIGTSSGVAILKECKG